MRMHCGGCAMKVAAKLYEVPGVAAVQMNVEAHTATVAPKAQQAPSPRALWEAVETAGYQPVKLVGPSGTWPNHGPSRSHRNRGKWLKSNAV